MKTTSKILLISAAALFLLVGCNTNKNDDKDNDLAYKNEYEIVKNGNKVHYVSNDREYSYKQKITGRSKNAEHDSYYVVLTNDKNVNFEEVDKKFWSSDLSQDKDFSIVDSGIIA